MSLGMFLMLRGRAHVIPFDLSIVEDAVWKSHIGECVLVEWIRCSPVTGSICTFCIRVPRMRSEISTSSVNEDSETVPSAKSVAVFEPKEDCRVFVYFTLKINE
ncbi:conserved hypothetical protein [Trichinella spiralis]|uniref:hypothetical protein n=1 Tax=Trichinella spiralis TaxID=6334 RepID=UPI0001EFDE61|nr:conserved hypothetical protein [Trichinella spiralis]